MPAVMLKSSLARWFAVPTPEDAARISPGGRDFAKAMRSATL